MDLEIDVPGVRASVKNLDLMIDRTTRQARFVWPNIILDGAAEIAQREISMAAPKGLTGDLKASVKIFRSNDKRTIAVMSPHAIFVNEGTDPSEGRFVPAIGKRLVSRRKHKPSSKTNKAAPGESKWWEEESKKKRMPGL